MSWGDIFVFCFGLFVGNLFFWFFILKRVTKNKRKSFYLAFSIAVLAVVICFFCIGVWKFLE